MVAQTTCLRYASLESRDVSVDHTGGFGLTDECLSKHMRHKILYSMAYVSLYHKFNIELCKM
jgi:hypothetical protein